MVTGRVLAYHQGPGPHGHPIRRAEDTDLSDFEGSLLGSQRKTLRAHRCRVTEALNPPAPRRPIFPIHGQLEWEGANAEPGRAHMARVMQIAKDTHILSEGRKVLFQASSQR